MHCLWEIIDNAVDEALGGFGREILVTLAADGGISVARPRPRHTGRHRAADRAVRGRGGVHQAARRRQVRRPGPTTRPAVCTASAPRWSTRCPPGSTSRWTATPRPGRCRSGVASRAPSTDRVRTATFTPGGGLRKVGRVAKGVTGTRVTYWPDRQIFLTDAQLVLEGPPGPGPADQLPGARAGPACWSTPATSETVEETFLHDGGISEFCEFLAPDAAGHRRAAAAGPGPVHRDGADARRRRSHGRRPTWSAISTSTWRVRWGEGYETRTQSYVNIIATPKGGTHVAGFERALTRSFSERAERHPAAQGRRGGGQGRRAGGDDRRRDRTAGRAAVRGPDQGGAGHAGGRQAGDDRGRARADRLPDVDQAQRSRPRRRRCWRRSSARPGPGWRRASTGRRSDARTRWSPRRCRPSWSTAAAATWTAPSCSSSRATRPWARPSWPGTRSSRRCCRSAARSSTSRRPRSATC